MPKLTLDGDASGAIKAIVDLTNAQKGIVKEGANAEKQLSKLSKEAQRIREAADPVNKYNRQIERLAFLTKKGELSIEDARKAAVKYEQQLRRTSNAGGQAFGASAIRNLGTYLTGLLSIQGAVSFVRSELEAFKQLEFKRSAAFLTAAEGEANLRENIAFSVSPKERERLINEARRIAKSRNLAEGATYDATGRAYGALGNVDLTIAATEAAAKMTRDMSKLGDIASGIGDVMTTAKIKDADIAAAFLGVTAGYSRVESPGQVAKQVGKVMAAYGSPLAGSTPARGAALFAAATTAGADPMGEATRTGVIQLPEKTRKFFEENADLYKLQKEQIDTFDERNALLLGNREMAEKFFRETKFESGVRGAFETLYLTDGSARAAYQDAFSRLATPDALKATAQEGFSFLDSGDLQRTARRANIISGGFNSVARSWASELSEEEATKLADTLRIITGEGEAKFNARTFAQYGSTWSEQEVIDEIGKTLSRPDLQGNLNPQLKEAVDALRSMETKLQELVTESKKKPPAVGRQR